MNTSHTPGPWHSYQSPTGLHYISAYSSPSQVIATASRLDDGIDNDAKEREAQANARLIAAAPDLLAALTGAEKALCKALSFCPPDAEAHFVGEWLAEVRAAIAKATP